MGFCLPDKQHEVSSKNGFIEFQRNGSQLLSEGTISIDLHNDFLSALLNAGKEQN
jgi:hypothetical protein